MDDEVTAGTLLDGLELLKKEDEPTLIIFPDLQNLVPTAAEVDAAEEAAQIAEDNEEVANKAKTAAAIAAAAVATVVDDNGDLEDAIAAALDVVDNYPVTDLNNLERVAENQAVQAVADATAMAATAAAAKTSAQAVANMFNAVFLTATAVAEASVNYATALSSVSQADITEAYAVYNSALDQAELMGDRFVIMDVLGAADTFRDRVISSGLKYGAAYHPMLKTILSYNYNEADVVVTGAFGIATLEALKTTNSEVYNQAKKAIEAKRVIMAPSSAMAGVYAKVDSTSGVWKAPANLGLNYVVAPTVKISHGDQEGLNVDPVAGKSINAIRSFTGKGTLVWGARTLDGNSNEWRYISVRRFFNMVEESVKKATERFVLNPIPLTHGSVYKR
jgi:Phage tail sheath protein FI